MDRVELQQIIEQGIREALVAGSQSGKRETSDLVTDILHRMEPMIEKSVEKSIAIYVPIYVNGKIDKISDTLKSQDIVLNNIRIEQVSSKAESTRVAVALTKAEKITIPILESKDVFTNVGVFILKFSAVIIAVATVYSLFFKK